MPCLCILEPSKGHLGHGVPSPRRPAPCQTGGHLSLALCRGPHSASLMLWWEFQAHSSPGLPEWLLARVACLGLTP